MKYRLDNIAASSNNAYGPNFWMWAGDTGSVWSELDMFEMDGKNWKMTPNAIFQKRPKPGYTGSDWRDTTRYCTTTWGTTNQVTPWNPLFSNPMNGGTWHTIGCEWTPEYIDYYYDQNDTIRRYSASKWWPVDKMSPMAIIVDLYMPAFQFCIPFVTGQTTEPINYDLDYVKVYQVKQNCNGAKTFLNTSSSTYADTLYQNLTIGGIGGSAVFNSGIHHLAGEDFVLLKEGFEASGANTTLIISTMKCQGGQALNYNSAPNPTPLTSTQLDILKISKSKNIE